MSSSRTIKQGNINLPQYAVLKIEGYKKENVCRLQASQDISPNILVGLIPEVDHFILDSLFFLSLYFIIRVWTMPDNHSIRDTVSKINHSNVIIIDLGLRMNIILLTYS